MASPSPSIDEHDASPKQIVLSGIIVDTQGLAEELYSLIKTGVEFEQLVAEYSPIETETITSLIDEFFSYQDLPEELTNAVHKVQPGSLIKPISVYDRWCVFRVEAWICGNVVPIPQSRR